ncbi:putative l-ascorbate peroxidase 6 [Quercus suber]|uniref:L-ascorbate peroxidase 6 n=1 Tax=Quercus suber TaxID=58331 RepID=A0AAW0LTS9_QUESU
MRFMPTPSVVPLEFVHSEFSQTQIPAPPPEASHIPDRPQGETSQGTSEEKKTGMIKLSAYSSFSLVFHDAGTFDMDENSGGMNGSIVYELERPENAGLKKPMKILEKAKTEVDAVKPVSWADMIAVVGAEAVSLCGGPTIPVPLGRLDSM